MSAEAYLQLPGGLEQDAPLPCPVSSQGGRGLGIFLESFYTDTYEGSTLMI